MADIASLVFEIDSSKAVEAAKNMTELAAAIDMVRVALDKLKGDKTVIKIDGDDWSVNFIDSILKEIYQADRNGRIITR